MTRSLWSRSVGAACALTLVASLSCAHRASTTIASTASAGPWIQVWTDEFDGAAGARVDTTKWRYDLSDGCAVGICGWGNDEKEYYTDARENIALDGNRASNENLDGNHSGLKGRLITDDGALHRFVNVYVNDEDVRFTGSLDSPLKDGDVVTILPAVAGGRG